MELLWVSFTCFSSWTEVSLQHYQLDVTINVFFKKFNWLQNWSNLLVNLTWTGWSQANHDQKISKINSYHVNHKIIYKIITIIYTIPNWIKADTPVTVFVFIGLLAYSEAWLDWCLINGVLPTDISSSFFLVTGVPRETDAAYQNKKERKEKETQWVIKNSKPACRKCFFMLQKVVNLLFFINKWVIKLFNYKN